MTLRLTLRQAPALRLDLRGVLPGLPADALAGLRLTLGRDQLSLAELFDVEGDATDGELVLAGDLSRCDRIGLKMTAGRLTVESGVGDYVGAGMTGGTLLVQGSARLLAGCEMAGGRLEIDGDAGDFAAGALPGNLDGMRGGSLIVRGNAGERFGDRMRRGTAIVFGDAGNFFASRLVAGTLAIAGRVGAHAGYGMRRGSVVFAGPAPAIPPTFVPSLVQSPVFWQLLSRDLAQHGGPFSRLASRPIQRHLGDLAADGKGEIIVVG